MNKLAFILFGLFFIRSMYTRDKSGCSICGGECE